VTIESRQRDGQERFAGPGFGTLVLHPGISPAPAPRVVSARATLRTALPAIYQDSDLAMRFVEAFERTLDPIGTVLDALPAHFDADHAPRSVLDLLCAWLGVDVEESVPTEARRDLVRRAGELTRRRGTAAGLRLLLELTFPALPLRVEDHGGVRYSAGAGLARAESAPQASFVVYCDVPIPEEDQAAIARCIERAKPVHATYRLRVKSAGKREGRT
jgi:phage tail-like protein